MPVETIKCRECGSADVTEFKPGSYVCGHCEAIFKHITPAHIAGGCQIDDCGVPAVGRCSSCNRRFCGTHQARDMGAERPVFRPTGPAVTRDTLAIYIDQCASCRADQLAREAKEKVAAEVVADSKRQEMLASEDPVMIATAVAAMDGYLDRYVLAKAWEDYHRLALPPPQFELVTLTDATRWTNPSEIARQPLWRCTCVILKTTIAETPKTADFHLDRQGRVARGRGCARQPVWDACIVPAGASLRFNRYARGRDIGWKGQKGRWNVEAEGALNSGPMRDDDLASARLLAMAICQLAGLTPNGLVSEWAAVDPYARDNRIAWWWTP